MDKLINQFLDYLNYEKNYSNYTILNYKKDLEQFKDFLNGKSIEDIDYTLIRKYLSYLYDKKYEAKTICRHISSLRAFYKYLISNNLVKENPLELISNPKVEKKLPTYLNYEQMEQILSIPDKNTALGLRNSLILELLYSTGIRVSEITDIKISDIDLYGNKIKIIGKGNKERYVLYGEVCKSLLEDYINISRKELDKENNEYLILNKNGKKITTRGIEKIIEKIIKESSLKFKISPHTIRHTFATHLLDGGSDLKIVQELLGHENLSTTAIYTHLSNERLKKVFLNAHPRAKK